MEKFKTRIAIIEDLPILKEFEQGIIKAERPFDNTCLLYTSPSPRDATLSRMPSSA